MEVNYKGIIWLKLKKDFMCSEYDTYLCLTYIPPEESSLYKNVNSSLFEFDFFEQLSIDYRRYSDLGDVYLTGDLNSRTGELPDFIPDIYLDRYLDMPQDTDVYTSEFPDRKNQDKQVNNYGNKLISFCKENGVLIANGRIEPGNCTFNSLYRNKPIASTVDYLITKYSNFKNISDFCVLDMTEFSDHCPVTFSFVHNIDVIDAEFFLCYDKIILDSSESDRLLNHLDCSRTLFDVPTEKLISGEIDIDSCLKNLSNVIYDISFKSFGRSVSNKPKVKKPKSPWFDVNCRDAKNEFIKNKRLFKSNNTVENKTNFLLSRSIYAKTKRQAKFKFYSKEKNKLSDMSKKCPRKFWKYIKKFKNKSSRSINDVGLDEFVQYFSSVSNTPHIQFDSNNYDNYRHESINIDLLDAPFTIDEIHKTISTLKRNKSSDLNNIVADFFIDAKAFISPYLCTIFNYIFDSGVYPQAWCKGVIIPIFKKGETNNPANYRGITLIDIMAKIFSLTLRNRINKWCESDNVFNDSQYGFRDNRSTTDAIFLLHAIIQKVLSHNSKLYCVFVDYERAFDTVIHEALWVKLLKSGLSCKMLNMIKSIYNNVQSCVKVSSDMKMSDFFNITLGLKQGEPLSPLLFILFINDISTSIDFNNLSENDLNILSMYLILFADDIVLFTTDPKSLQAQINSISQYSLEWGLKVNVKKTKICIFEKRKQKHNNVEFHINNDKIEIVDNFVYLGIKFTHTGNLSQAVKALSDQALKAYFSLLGLSDRVPLTVKTKLQLFDTMVVPILLYGSKVWGVYNFKEINKLHIKFCKYI